MVRFKFIREGEKTKGFVSSGHAGHGQHGQDIVCAAVSSAAYLAANTVTDFFGAKARVQVSEGYMALELAEENAPAQTLLNGLEAHIRQLAKEYPRSIKVIYGGNTNA